MIKEESLSKSLELLCLDVSYAFQRLRYLSIRLRRAVVLFYTPALHNRLIWFTGILLSVWNGAAYRIQLGCSGLKYTALTFKPSSLVVMDFSVILRRVFSIEILFQSFWQASSFQDIQPLNIPTEYILLSNFGLWNESAQFRSRNKAPIYVARFF